MHKLIVSLPGNRDFEGSLRLEDGSGRLIAGPFAVCGRADRQAAGRHGNPSGQALLPFGDTPLGRYRMTGILPTGRKTHLPAERFGPYGVVVLRPMAGEAALADANGRFCIVIQGGKLGRGRRLRPTNGSLRLADKDQQRLVRALRKRHHCVCECVAAAEPETGRTVAVDAAYEEADPPLASSMVNLPGMATTSARLADDRLSPEGPRIRHFAPSFRLFADSGGSGGGGGSGDGGYPGDSGGEDSGGEDSGGEVDLKWSSDWRDEDKDVVQGVMNNLPEAKNDPEVSQAFKQWVSENVQFTRGTTGSSAPWLGVSSNSPNSLKVEDSFLNAVKNPTAQNNVLTLELGKVLWYQVNGSDTEVAQTHAGHDFQNLLDQHPAMNHMKFAPPVTTAPDDLPALADFADLQSRFGYAVRVAVGNLGPPPTASPDVKRDWPQAVQAMQLYLKNHLPRKR